MPTFKANRDAYIKRLNGIYLKNAEGAEIDYIIGTAKFTAPKEVQV